VQSAVAVGTPDYISPEILQVRLVYLLTQWGTFLVNELTLTKLVKSLLVPNWHTKYYSFVETSQKLTVVKLSICKAGSSSVLIIYVKIQEAY
jgi:hypothetical protein